MKKIAYLAPEIPSLSATFVYNEVLALQKEGLEIVPISVHRPKSPATDKHLDGLLKTTHYLYQKGLTVFIISTLYLLCTAPRTLGQSLQLLVQDLSSIKFSTRLSIGLIYRFLAASTVARILLKERCEHIHVHFAHVPTDIAMYASIMAGVPFSFTAHANDLFEHNWLLTQKTARSKFSITISNFNRKFMLNQGCDPDKIHVIYCGVDSSRFVRAALRKPVLPYVIGSLGRMVEKKGFDFLLQAAKILKDSGIQFRLVVAGSGPLEQRLRSTINDLGLFDIVSFPGPMAYTEVPNWLQTLDLFVLPCQQDSNGDMDGIPVVLMEAMAAGVPVISTTLSGIPELITHNFEGLLAPPCSAQLLSKSITKLLLERSLRNQFIAHAKEKIKNNFEERNNILKLLKLFMKTTKDTANGTKNAYL